jgi:hypothetical protein
MLHLLMPVGYGYYEMPVPTRRQSAPLGTALFCVRGFTRGTSGFRLRFSRRGAV